VLQRQNEDLDKFVYYKDKVVGALCSRIEPIEGDEKQHRLYIMTLAVLAAYRGRGIGSELFRTVLEYCSERQSAQLSAKDDRVVISKIVLHVQVSNRDAIRFYTERFGFVQGELVENYYRRVDPPHCYLLYKQLTTSECASQVDVSANETGDEEPQNEEKEE